MLDEKRIMHVDTSRQFYERADTGIAFKIVKSREHGGLVLSNKLKRELDKNIKSYENYSKLYAICIYNLIKDNLKIFDILVICEDENFNKTKQYLGALFRNNSEYFNKQVISIRELRELSGNMKLRSYADSIANVYRRKALKPLYRRQRGIPLNLVTLGYKTIVEQWGLLDKS